MFKIVFGLVRDVRGQGLLSCQIPKGGGGGREKTANAPSSINTVTFFIDRTVN